MKPHKLFFLSAILLITAIVLPVVAEEMNMDMGTMDMGKLGYDMQPPGHDAMAAHSGGGDVNWFVIALFLLLIVASGFLVFRTQKSKKINFLDNPPLKSLLKSTWYPLIFVAPTILIFSIVVIELFFGSDKTSFNFGSVMVWILLWPILPILFLLFGRLWCSVCPLLRVSDEVQKK